MRGTMLIEWLGTTQTKWGGARIVLVNRRSGTYCCVCEPGAGRMHPAAV